MRSSTPQHLTIVITHDISWFSGICFIHFRDIRHLPPFGTSARSRWCAALVQDQGEQNSMIWGSLMDQQAEPASLGWTEGYKSSAFQPYRTVPFWERLDHDGRECTLCRQQVRYAWKGRWMIPSCGKTFQPRNGLHKAMSLFFKIVHWSVIACMTMYNWHCTNCDHTVSLHGWVGMESMPCCMDITFVCLSQVFGKKCYEFQSWGSCSN